MTKQKINKAKSRLYHSEKAVKLAVIPPSGISSQFISGSGDGFPYYGDVESSITSTSKNPCVDVWINLQPWNRGYEHHNKLIINYLLEFNTPQATDTPTKFDLTAIEKIICSYVFTIADVLTRRVK
jgi:hypothetical protein